MNALFKFWEVVNKVREFLRGKKTLLSAITGLCTSTGLMIPIVVSWADGQIDIQTMYKQIIVPGAIWWASVTFIFNAVHPNNVIKQSQALPSQAGGNTPIRPEETK